MFLNYKDTILRQRDEIKQKALEISSLSRENVQLNYAIKNVKKLIKEFDHVNDNPFSLINDIEKELEIK